MGNIEYTVASYLKTYRYGITVAKIYNTDHVTQ